jgi:hypothetical protein
MVEMQMGAYNFGHFIEINELAKEHLKQITVRARASVYNYLLLAEAQEIDI